MLPDRLIGVDVGGSTIKGAVVVPSSGTIDGERAERVTPAPATPRAIAQMVRQVVDELSCGGPVGVALPCVVNQGTAQTAVNIDETWVGTDAAALLRGALGRPVSVLNDADAAGLAEARFGHAKGLGGTVVTLTFGTGVGSAVVQGGKLVTNFEFGQLTIAEGLAERRVSIAAMRREKLTWAVWCDRVNRLLSVIGPVSQAELLINGGRFSEPDYYDHWRGHVTAGVDVVPALLGNNAGMIGAALRAADDHSNGPAAAT